MKFTNSNCLFVLIFLSFGCSASKNTILKRNQNSKNNIVHYYVKTEYVENGKYDTLIENKFRELENLKLPFVKIHYNKKDSIKFDCEINIVFDSLTINDKKYSKNKYSSKLVHTQQLEADGTTSYGSQPIRKYTYQQIKERKLNWTVLMKTVSNSNKCESKNNTFTESFKSKSIIIPLSEKLLLSRREMAEKAINRVYNKIVYQFKRNN